MGYNTEFEGRFQLSKNLSEQQFLLLEKLATTRRMKRDVAILQSLGEDPYLTDLGYGDDGEYFVNGSGSYGQDKDVSVIDYDMPPSTQPSLWCQWLIKKEREFQYLEWNGVEKFHGYVEWLKYLIDHFFSRWEVFLNGETRWFGQDHEDLGLIIIADNKITVKKGTIIYT